MQVMSSSFALKRIGIFNSRPSTQTQSQTEQLASQVNRRAGPWTFAQLVEIPAKVRGNCACFTVKYEKVRTYPDSFPSQVQLLLPFTAEEEPSASSLSSVIFLKLNQLGKQECGAELRSSEVLVMYNICKHVKLL